MGKKRKAGGQPFGHERSADVPEARTKLRINTYEDVANSEDEFFINRDKILLEEGPAQKRQRKAKEAEQYLEFSDEEVLAESESISESDEFHEEDEATREPKNINSRAIALHESDSEAVADPEDDYEIGGWGTSRQDYYNTDNIETEADALEEEVEARRLQQKQLQGLTEEDFGFDEKEWLEAGKPVAEGADDNKRVNVVQEVLPGLEITDAMGPEERLKIIRTRYPEFELLRKEFMELQAKHDELESAAEASTTSNPHPQVKLNGSEINGTYEEQAHIAVVKHSALRAYLAALCMYFVLLTSGPEDQNGKTTAMPPAELRNHTIMSTLVQCRELWGKVKDVQIPDQNGLTDAHDDTMNDGVSKLEHGIEEQDTEKISNSEKQPIETLNKIPKTKAEKALAAAQAKVEALRLERIHKTEQDLLNLDALISTSKPTKSSLHPSRKRISSPTSSDFGEQTSLTLHEALEKAQRKKSLRFYTSQIAQKSQKRDTAGRDAGGDHDVPYRERLRDRQDRLNAEAESRGAAKKKEKGKGKDAKSDTLGGDSEDDEDRRVAHQLRDGEQEEDYYALVSARHSALKNHRSSSHPPLPAPNNNTTTTTDDPAATPGSKRAITYAIARNKGLAPRRKKEVRNPRVKKRLRYEAKKKKLGSVRQVWKEGGEGRGGYGGERTGVKIGLKRGVKL